MIFLLIILDIMYLLIAIKRPTLFIILYILATTKFLGFFSLTIFIINGVDLGFFSINLVVLLSIFFNTWFIIKKNMFLLLILFLFIILYGILFPIINGYETIKQAIIASKPFLFLFLFYYLVVNFNRINVFKIMHFIKFLSLYLSIIEILYIFFNIAPPFYINKYDYLGSYIRIFYPTYISLGWFLFYIDYLYKRINVVLFILISIVLLIGLSIAGHFALTIMSLLLIVSLWLFFNKTNFSIFKFIKNILFISILFLIILTIFDKLRNQFINSLELIFTGTDIALVSREHYNKFRWEAIDKSPIFGYGFIHKDANVMKNFNYNPNNRFTEKLGVQDSGYVDLLVRFGYLGTFIYLLIIFRYLLYFYKIKNKNYYLLPLVAFIFQYYFVNYTWAVFSFPFGTVPMIITLFLLFKLSKNSMELYNES